MSLVALARAAGLDAEYTSWRGEPARSSDDSLLAMLRMLGPQLGFRCECPEDAAAALVDCERARWARVVPHVVVGWPTDEYGPWAAPITVDVPMSVPADTDQPFELEIETESGAVVRAAGKLFELFADNHAWPGGVVHCVRHAKLPVTESGYHKLRWSVGSQTGEAMVIAAPKSAFGGPGAGRKRWGVFAPVFGLASPRSGPAGDLASLRELFAAVDRRGGSYVATLPILAQFLDEPCAFSPYSPASRLFWNELYLELDTGHAPPIVAGTLIDFREQYRWRRRAIDALAPSLLATRGNEIDAWARDKGAYDYAMFRALGEAHRTGWHDWKIAQPAFAATREAAIAAGADTARIDAHVVAQWAMQQQLEALDSGRVKLYLDLPVGVNTDAYEVWRWRELFLIGASAGAPPDPLFLGGQDWGLPPVSPSASQREHHRYLIACVRHHMRVAGMLRVDHVMGLFRLYCVPNGRPATDGVYVRYPYDELLAILALESSRAQCALVGEDLGTVPDVVRPAMARRGLFRIHVGQWHLPARVGDSPAPSPPESVAALNTHDTATFAGWWRGADIDDKRDLGLIGGQEVAVERADRVTHRAALLAFADPKPDDTLTEVERAMVAATADLARGPAEVVLVALDDLVLEPVPHNVPGTTTQRPNWQRRVERWADVLDPDRAPPAAAATIAQVVAARPDRRE